MQERLLFCEIKQAIFSCSRRWGKSLVTALPAAMVAMWPSGRQSGEFLRKVQKLLWKAGMGHTGPGKLRRDGVEQMNILLPNRRLMIASPGVEGTLHGFPAVDFLIADDAAQVRDGQYYAVQPMLAMGYAAVWGKKQDYLAVAVVEQCVWTGKKMR